ncbi:hypothetical protein CRYUN_Cryun09bG0102900 [Craigia yunnanensis]
MYSKSCATPISSFSPPLNGKSKRIGYHLSSTTTRGLLDHAVAMLKTWLSELFLHPYPIDTKKLMLARQTGLSMTQVSNWFINVRVRLWKPIVEEMHILELRQA